MRTSFKYWIVPIIALCLFLLRHYTENYVLIIGSVLALVACILQSVHHAEVIAKRVGEPFGALILAISITVIEVSIILSFMMTGENENPELARDTVFAAVMIIITGMSGLTLLIGGIKYKEQEFLSQGVVSLLTVLVTISVFTFVLPNFTSEIPGPYYTKSQLAFVAIITLLLYFGFLFVQNFKHRNHFTSENEISENLIKPGKIQTLFSSVLLPLNLILVVLTAESLAPDLEHFIEYLGAPMSLSGIIIAAIILLPEGISAVKAASQNNMQKSLNLSLGSALASISLTIPIVAIYSIYAELPLALGINKESTVLFILSLFVLILSLVKGKTTILQGFVLLIIFAVYLFLTITT